MSVEKKTDNLLMRIMLETVQNVVGTNGVKSILNYAHLEKYIDNFPPDNDDLEIPTKDLRLIHLALIELFGSKGARSFQLRIGREIICLSLEKRPGIAKALQMAARLLPETKRMRIGLEKFAEQMQQRQSSTLDSARLELQEEEDYFLLVDRDYHGSEGVTSLSPACNVYIGMIKYLMEWITGTLHEVEEIECRAMGHPADVFKISKARKE